MSASGDQNVPMTLQAGNGCGCAGCSGDNAVSNFLASGGGNDVGGEISAPSSSATPAQFADYLTNGFWQSFYNANNFTFSGHSKEALTYSISNSYSADQAVGIRKAFDLWQDVADITFTEVGSGGDIPVITNAEGRAFAANNWSYSSSEGVYEISTTHISVDTSQWFWNDFNNPGDYALTTMIHEIGHTLGLGHSGNYNAGQGNPTYANDAIWTNDTRQYTVMSYFDASNSGANHGVSNYGATPLIYDILAIQNLYGANTSTRSGNTTYGFNSTAGRDSYDFTINDRPVVALWDGGGVDTLDLSGFSNTQTIRMDEGVFSDIAGLTSNFIIAYGVTLENVTGGSGADTIYTNSSNNVILGNNGNDYVYGSTGSDNINGGSGTDTVSYTYGVNDFVITLIDSVTLTLQNVAQGFTDTLSNIETFLLNGVNYTFSALEALTVIDGTSGNDTLNGNSGNNTINGGAGNDIISAGNGNDTINGGVGNDNIDGGDGVDTVNYSTITHRVVVNLTAGFSDEDGIGGIEDTLTNVENVVGTSLHDIIYGSADDNEIWGGGGTDDLRGYDGDDVLHGDAGNDSLAGYNDNDTLNGGAGVDTLNGGAGNDTLNGGTENDLLLGGDNTDILNGDEGADRLYGQNGNDTLDGGAGNDYLYGGTGDDTYQLALGAGNDLISENSGEGTDTLRITGGITENDIFIWAGADRRLTVQLSDGSTLEVASYANAQGATNASERLERIEFDNGTIWDLTTGITYNGLETAQTFYGSNGNDTMNANGGNDLVLAANGNDTVNGGDGDDTVNGGAGNDILNGDAGVDTLVGADGNDTLSGGAGNDNLDGGVGLDILNGGDDDDNLNGRAGDDTLRGDAGADTLEGGNDNDTLYGGTGNDTLRGGTGNDILFGEADDDILFGLLGNDDLNGGAGTDTLTGGGGDDRYFFTTGYGNDLVREYESGGTDTIRITGLQASEVFAYVEANRQLVFELADGSRLSVESYGTSNGGSNAVNRIERVEFDDGTVWDYSTGLTLNGLTTAQTLYGSDLNDTISGNGGDDVLNGIYGNDTIHGGTGNDTINGGHGDDILNGDDGDDTLDGGVGADTLRGGNDIDTLRGRDGDDILYGDDGADLLFGGNQNDTLNGGEGDDYLNGEAGNDTLRGDNGADRLFGFDGNDILYGGDGLDSLYGQNGADTFVFEAATAYNNVDQIKDFSLAQKDKIDISDLLSAYDPLAHALTDFVQITDDGTHSTLSVDADGGGDNFVAVALIQNITGITGEDNLVAANHLIVT